MTPHLPYAYDEYDEFLHPTMGWLLLDRAIAYDGWISWRHALPENPYNRNSIPVKVSEAITFLAEEIHSVHQKMPGYADLGESPLVFPRWWDPYSGDEWATGLCCLFRVSGFTSGQVLQHWNENSSLAELKAVSGSHIEARVKTTPEGDLPSRPGPTCQLKRTRGKGRKHQTPPP